jgi:hypothetical protein
MKLPLKVTPYSGNLALAPPTQQRERREEKNYVFNFTARSAQHKQKPSVP